MKSLSLVVHHLLLLPRLLGHNLLQVYMKFESLYVDVAEKRWCYARRALDLNLHSLFDSLMYGWLAEEFVVIL